MDRGGLALSLYVYGLCVADTVFDLLVPCPAGRMLGNVLLNIA